MADCCMAACLEMASYAHDKAAAVATPAQLLNLNLFVHVMFSLLNLNPVATPAKPSNLNLSVRFMFSLLNLNPVATPAKLLNPNLFVCFMFSLLNPNPVATPAKLLNLNRFVHVMFSLLNLNPVAAPARFPAKAARYPCSEKQALLFKVACTPAAQKQSRNGSAEQQQNCVALQ